MKKNTLIRLAVLAPFLFGCSLSLLSTPTGTVPTGTQNLPSGGLATILLPSPTEASPTPQTVTVTETPTPEASAPTSLYAVIGVEAGDSLTIRSAPGADSPAIGSLAPGATGVQRTGPSSPAAGDLWVQVVNPAGGTGWVNARFLTEYVSSADFCADERVSGLIQALEAAVRARNGQALADLASPAHGVTVYLWRYGNGIPFDREHIRWAFESTYAHNWGPAPGSGLDTIGSFQESVEPPLQAVFGAAYTLTCNSLGSAPQYSLEPWPARYTHINYYTAYKSGTPGIDLDWVYWLIGVEYVQGQPTLFALIHTAWEP